LLEAKRQRGQSQSGEEQRSKRLRVDALNEEVEPADTGRSIASQSENDMDTSESEVREFAGSTQGGDEATSSEGPSPEGPEVRGTQLAKAGPQVPKVKATLPAEGRAKGEAGRSMSASEREHQNQRVLKNVRASQGKSK
jgi:hypothetical protein